ncbi:MAG: hypothetical protein GY847_05520 [Proteobacteria bacterium]|nr:hypothetical protein [Pseudomonadota bacterium]
MRILPRRRQRTFRLSFHIPPFDDLAREVVNGIEKDVLKVVDPTQEGCIDLGAEPGGTISVDSDANLYVQLKEWLAVGCQRIRWEEGTEDLFESDQLATYRTNIPLVFGVPYGDSEPLGPSVFIGEIIISRKVHKSWFEMSHSTQTQDGLGLILQYIIAHELVHVFDALKYVVPAFMDWRSFYKNVLDYGTTTEALYTRLGFKSRFIDEYGKGNEPEMIREWWPSLAEKLFEARKLDWAKFGL